jgi:hypothetical protein
MLYLNVYCKMSKSNQNFVHTSMIMSTKHVLQRAILFDSSIGEMNVSTLLECFQRLDFTDRGKFYRMSELVDSVKDSADDLKLNPIAGAKVEEDEELDESVSCYGSGSVSTSSSIDHGSVALALNCLGLTFEKYLARHNPIHGFDPSIPPQFMNPPVRNGNAAASNLPKIETFTSTRDDEFRLSRVRMSPYNQLKRLERIDALISDLTTYQTNFQNIGKGDSLVLPGDRRRGPGSLECVMAGKPIDPQRFLTPVDSVLHGRMKHESFDYPVLHLSSTTMTVSSQKWFKKDSAHAPSYVKMLCIGAETRVLQITENIRWSYLTNASAKEMMSFENLISIQMEPLS